MTTLSVEDKIQNACFQLNHDAYVLQAKTHRNMHHFKPCEKSLVLLDCLNTGGHFGTAIATAALTGCTCHNSLTQDQLFAMCFDDTARRQHYGELKAEITA